MFEILFAEIECHWNKVGTYFGKSPRNPFSLTKIFLFFAKLNFQT